MTPTALCTGCSKPIPEARRRDSKFCSPKCRSTYRARYFATPAGAFPPGEYLLFQRAAVTGLVLVSHTRALRTRIRTAQASCGDDLTVIGIVTADRARAERFKRAHAADCVRGSWYRPSPAVLLWIQRRTHNVTSLAIAAPPAVASAAARLSAKGEQEHGPQPVETLPSEAV